MQMKRAFGIGNEMDLSEALRKNTRKMMKNAHTFFDYFFVSVFRDSHVLLS